MNTKSVQWNGLCRSLAVATIAAFCLSAASGAMAESIDEATTDDERLENEAGMGVASAAASLLYGPAKLVYAGGGGFIAGMAYLVSAGDNDVVMPILNASLRGDYVLTPDHLQGREPIEFVGRDPELQELREQSTAWEDANRVDGETTFDTGETVDATETYQTEDDFGPWQRPQATNQADTWVNENVGNTR